MMLINASMKLLLVAVVSCYIPRLAGAAWARYEDCEGRMTPGFTPPSVRECLDGSHVLTAEWTMERCERVTVRVADKAWRAAAWRPRSGGVRVYNG